MNWLSLLMWVTQFGFSVIFPLCSFFMIGAWLQNKYNLSPWCSVFWGILSGHMRYVAPLGKGRGFVTTQGQKRHCTCRGGMISVLDGNVTLVAEFFEWLDVAGKAGTAVERAE